MSNAIIVISLILLAVLYLEPNIITVPMMPMMEQFTQRINNLQSIPFMLRDRDVFERRRDYHRMNPSEFSRIGTKAPEPKVPDIKDAVLDVTNGKVKVDPNFTHTNMVPFFKKQPYRTYTDGDASHPQLDRFNGDRPKRSVIAPLYDLGKTRYANLNETLLIDGYNREVENYKANTVSQNSKNFEFVGGDPVRVGRGIVTPETDAITGSNGVNSKELRDGTLPSGGFHPMYRPDELTRDQLTGETRPLFNEAYVFVGINGQGVNIPADPSFIGEQTKAMKAKSFSLDECKSNIATSGTLAQTARAEIVRKQMKTNDAPNPYRGPPRMEQSSVNNIESVYEPKLPKTLDTVNCINYYATTSDPATYEPLGGRTRSGSDHTTKEQFAAGDSFVSKYAVNVARDSRSNEPLKRRESYADYSYIKDNVQRHVYMDYDPYDYNTVHTGNEYVTVTRTGNINSEQRPVLYDPQSADKVPKSAETERIRKLREQSITEQQGITEFGEVVDRVDGHTKSAPRSADFTTKLTELSSNGKQTVTAMGSMVDRKIYETDNDPFRIEYISNNRDSLPVQDKSVCVSIDNSGEYKYREDRKSNEYIEQRPERYNSQREDKRSGYELLDIELYKEKKAGTLTERIGTLGSGLIKTLFSIGTDDIRDSVKVNDKRNSSDALEHSNGYHNAFQDSTRVTPELRKSAVQYDQMAESLFNSTGVNTADRKSTQIKNRNRVADTSARENIHIKNEAFL